MNDDELLSILAETARRERAEERGRLDDRWDRLAAGSLSDAEGEQLLVEADESIEKSAAYEAFRPLGAEFRARMAHQLGAGLDTGGPAQPTARGESELHAQAPVPDSAERVVPFPSRRTRWLPMAMAAGLLVAVGAFWVHQLPVGGSLLPGYTLSVGGSVKALRGEDGSESSSLIVLAPGNRLRLLLTPDSSVDGDVSARVYLERAGALDALQIPDPRVSDDGAVLIEGVIGGSLNVPPGRSELIVMVGRESALPDLERATRVLGTQTEAKGEGWAVWRRQIIME